MKRRVRAMLAGMRFATGMSEYLRRCRGLDSAPQRSEWEGWAAIRATSALREETAAGEREADLPRPGTSPPVGDRARSAMRLRHFSPRTEEAYLHWIPRFWELHGRRDLARLGPEHVTAFLGDLASRVRVAPSTQNKALGALLFLYREVLGGDLPWLDGLVRARRPARLPVVFARDEVRAVLLRMDGAPRIMATLLYGSGLRFLGD